MKFRLKIILSTFFASLFVLCPCALVYGEGAEQTINASFEAASAADQTEASVASHPATQVKLTVKASDSSLNCKKVVDNKERTKLNMQKKTTFTVKADREFENLYLKFEKNCDWVIKLPDGQKITPDAEDYIHKYLPLGKKVTSFKLTMPKYSGLTDICAFTDGQPPDWVQLWQPPCERADLMVMPTHADDEYLWFGGAIPYYAGELGYDVQVVYLTNHNNATIRNHERLNSLWTVGVRHYPIVSPFMDVNESRYSAEDAAKEFGGYKKVMAFQVEMLRRFKPRVILAHDINGEYGHGAHKLNAETILEALKLSDNPKSYPDSAKKYGTCKIQKCYLHLWKENKIVVSWSDKKLSRFGGKTSLEMAAEGFKCDASQIISYKVEEGGRFDCRKFGLAYTTVGNDTPGVNDFFENVDWSDKKPGTTEIIEPTETTAADPEIEAPVSPSHRVSSSDHEENGKQQHSDNSHVKLILFRLIPLWIVLFFILVLSVILLILQRKHKKSIR